MSTSGWTQAAIAAVAKGDIPNAIAASTPGGIERQEAESQSRFIERSVLPTQGPWDKLIALGFERGELVIGDPLFTHAKLPPGWTKAKTGHSMHSDVLDERGIARVGVFYKGAFYDRRADFSLLNPGKRLFLDVCYNDVKGVPTSLGPKWEVFTATERQDFLDSLEYQMQEDEKRVNSKYPPPRTREWMEAVRDLAKST